VLYKWPTIAILIYLGCFEGFYLRFVSRKGAKTQREEGEKIRDVGEKRN
jgi:hypothetical protein